MCADAPDMSGTNRAAEANAALSKESLDFYKQVYAEQAPQREAAAKIAMDIAGQQLASSKLNDTISQDYWNYQKDTYRPLEQGIVADAQAYDTPAKREAAASEAVADVGMQAQAARQAQARQQQRMGVNPSSGKTLALDSQLSMAEALGKAGAANKARDTVETQGYARKMDAANLGRNLASNQATSAGVALNAGNSAVGNAGVPLAQSNAAVQTAGQGFNTAIQGNNSAGQLYGQAAQLSSQDSGLMGALGGVAGQFAGSARGSAAIASLFSDEGMKSNTKKPANTGKMLKAIESTKINADWKYEPSKGGPDDGGRPHDGPMAQEVRRTMGDKAAPGGKVIDLATMNANLMGGMQELAKRVKKLEGAKA